MMSALQAMAMSSAITGDWQLADAMELISRNASEPWIVGGVLVNGRMRGLVINPDTLNEFEVIDGSEPEVIDLNGNPSHLQHSIDLAIDAAEGIVGNAAAVIALEDLRNAH